MVFNCMTIDKRLVLIILLTSIIGTTINVQNTYADVQSAIFVNYAYSGLDSYYGVNVVGYRENSYGAVIVTVVNDVGADIRLNKLALIFEWGDVFLAGGLPETIPKGSSRVYVIDFTVPSITKAANIRPYVYRIEANYTNLATNVTSIWTYRPTNYFAVFSKEQKEYYDLRSEFTYYLQQYPTTWFTSIKAIELVRKAHAERQYADYQYSTGNFTGAVIMYRSAISTYKTAISIEINYRYIPEQISINRSLIDLERTRLDLEMGRTYIDLMRNEINISRIMAEAELIRANADMKFAEAELLRASAEVKKAEAEIAAAENIKYYAYAIMVFGIGFIIISIGLAIRFAKK